VTAGLIFDFFERLVAEGKTILMVSHDPTLSRRVKRVVRIADGQLVEQATAILRGAV
jgi:putative ABC transport system ATP-binding protein